MVHLSARKAFIFQSKRRKKILHLPDLFFDLFSWTSNHILLDWSDVTKTTFVYMDCFFAKIVVPGNGCVSDQCILYFEYFASYFQKTNKKSVKKKFNKKFTIFFFFFFFEVAKKSQENWSEKMELEKYFEVTQKLIDQAGQVIREATLGKFKFKLNSKIVFKVRLVVWLSQLSIYTLRLPPAGGRPKRA